MFTVIRFNYLHLESIKDAALEQVEWSFDFACSDENKLGRNTVKKDAGLLE